MRYQGTNIDGPSLDPERLNVRGRDLNDLVGNVSYGAAQYFFLTGEDLDAAGTAAIDRLLGHSLLAPAPDSALLRTACDVATSGANPSEATIAALMTDVDATVEALVDNTDLSGLDLPRPVAEGLAFVGLMPTILAYAIEGARDRTRLDSLLAGADRDRPYADLVFEMCTARTPENGVEARLFEAVLTAFIGGFGFLTPTVMLPRMAAATRSPMAVCIAAGYTGAGPAHTGACEYAMLHQEAVQTAINVSPADPATVGAEEIARVLGKGKRVPGFGHPLFRADPRIARLRELVAETGFESIEVETFEIVAAAMLDQTELNPNIDGIASALFRSMDLMPEYGTGLFMCSRTGDMVAHVLEKLEQPPFGATSFRRPQISRLTSHWMDLK